MKKVLICGPCWHDELENLLSRGFQDFGWETMIFNDVQRHWTVLAGKISARTPFRKIADAFSEQYRRKITAQFVSVARDFSPNLIFVINGRSFSGGAIAKIREQMRIPVVNLLGDDPAASKTALNDIRFYSEIFVVDKSWIPAAEFFNFGHVSYLPHIGDFINFKPLPGAKKNIDIAFGGSLSLKMPNAPAGYLRAQILNSLSVAGFSVAIHGAGAKEAALEFAGLRKAELVSSTTGHIDLNELYNRARIVLSIDSPQLKAGIAPRVFDIAFSGSFELAQYSPVIEEFFPQGAVRTFKNIPELLELARYYLDHEQERENSASVAREHALKYHCSKERVREILEKLNLIK